VAIEKIDFILLKEAVAEDRCYYYKKPNLGTQGVSTSKILVFISMITSVWYHYRLTTRGDTIYLNSLSFGIIMII